jgi:hypothetical protein
MTEDDKLLLVAVVKPGHRYSKASVAAAGAKDLCMRYGQSNFGPWEAWKPMTVLFVKLFLQNSQKT